MWQAAGRTRPSCVLPPAECERWTQRTSSVASGTQRAIRGPSEGHQRAIRGSSEGHQRAIRGPSEGHQRAIRGPSEGHQRVIRGHSEGHQRTIRGSSEGHRSALRGPSEGQRTIRGPSEGHQRVRGPSEGHQRAIRGPSVAVTCGSARYSRSLSSDVSAERACVRSDARRWTWSTAAKNASEVIRGNQWPLPA
jgi:hypothetical protein